MRFVVHAGIHKTGTTSVQRFLTDNASTLLDHGVYYPTGYFQPWRRQHSALASALRRRDADLVNQFFDHCADHGATQSAHTVIVSGEALSTLGASDLTRLNAAICRSDPTARIDIVLYYRNLYDLTISLMQQAAKKNRWLFEDAPDRNVVNRLEPTRQIERFEQVFGDSHVNVGIFEDAIGGAGLERHFLELVGINWSDDLVAAESRNVSIDLITTTFFNMLGYEYGLDSSMWRQLAEVAPMAYALPTTRNHLIEELHETVAAIDVSHPKLADARAVLTAPRWVPTDQRPELTEYLRSFEAFVRELRRAARKRKRVEERGPENARAADL